MTSPRFLHGLTFRIMGVFLLVLAVTNGLIAVSVRQRIKTDLEGGTKADLLNGMQRLEADLDRLRDGASLFAEIAARTATGAGPFPGRKGDTAAFQIAVVERSRAQGIRIDEFHEGAGGRHVASVLLRGFAGMPTVDYVMRGEGAGPLHMIAVAPVNAEGGPRRVMTATVPLDREFLRREKESLGGDVTVLYPGGLLASSSSCAECVACMKDNLFREAQLRKLSAGTSLYFTWECGKSGAEAAAVLPLKTFDGRTVAFALSRSREGDRRALNHATVLVALGSVLLAGAVSLAFYLLLSRATAPLRNLTRLARGISEGRYGETIDVRGRDEVADLGEAFNRMSLSLKNAMEENSAWNARLESRVEEKSRELAKIHRQMVEVEKLAAMGQLSAGVAHEINNPLSGILGYAELGIEAVRRNAEGPLPAEEAAKVASYFAQIESLSHRCRVIILDMLRFARQHPEETREIDINAALLQTLVFVDKQLARNGVSVATHLEEGLPLIRGNVLQLQQVFTNIILNSSQAMPGGGTVAIRTALRGERVEAEIEDTGKGIPDEHLHRIFDPFFTTKPVGEGTGLGLSVSYGIVQQHGGEIRVASEVGKGSVFTVSLPVRPASAVPS